MSKSKWLWTIGGAAALVLALVVARSEAMQLGKAATALSTAVEEESLVQEAWGCHHFCAFGAANGWHRHVGPRCQVVRC